MLDVLIIGGGPHALTLASLLSRPDPDPNSDHGSDPLLSHSCSDPQRPRPNPEASNYKCCSGKRKRKAKAGQTVEEKFAELKTSERITCPPISLRVVDAYGQWTALWESQFSALNIPHLRSHTLVHTDPFNKTAFQEYVQTNGRSAELHSLPDQVYILDQHAFFNDMRLGKKEKKRLRVTSSLKNSLSLSLPGTQLSLDFFKEQVKRYKLDEVLVKGIVERIIPVMEDKKEMDDEQKGDGGAENLPGGARKRVKHFQVHLREGDVLEASQVVVATGPTREQMANIPSWVNSIGESYPEERLQHTVNLMHRLPKFRQKLSGTDRQTPEETFSPHGLYVVCEAGQRVMVVGGGLTSAHVVSIALRQGASHVTWVMRKHLQLKQFDVGDVESLVGRYSHVEHGIKLDGQAYLRQFYNERSLHKRLAMIRQARKGGAVTPEAYTHLQPFILSGQVEVKAYCQVSEASWDYKNQAWSLSLSTGDHWTGDMIWLATGCKLDVKEDSLLSEVIKEFPIQVIDGWPCISESLQWTEGCPLYLMGQYTALQVGPHAVNLAGGQAASMRITKDIMFRQLQDGTQAFNVNGDRSKTEDYVQQMRGLLWL